MQTLLRCLCSPHVQSHASPSVHALKITMAATQLFGHTVTLHTLTGMGSAALAAAVPYAGKAIQISRMGQRILFF